VIVAHVALLVAGSIGERRFRTGHEYTLVSNRAS
jgi:hypothetical protein